MVDEKTLNTLLLLLVIFAIVGGSLFWGHIQHKRDDLKWEYYIKFVQPKILRAQKLGLSDERIGELWQEAQASTTDPTIVGGAPSAIFDSLIDREVGQ